MKTIRLIFIVTLALCVSAVSAQKNIQIAYEKATALNDQREYLKAAKAFQQVQEMALQAGETDWYIHSVTAAGECYYMLNTATQMKAQLDKAKAAYAQYAPTAGDSLRLTWYEAISKLEGSYEFMQAINLNYGPSAAESAFKRCLAIIDTLQTISLYDDEEAAVIIHRELMGLYYHIGITGRDNKYRTTDFNNALKEANEVCHYYGNMGYNVNPRTAADHRFNSSYVDAFRSKAMVLARLNRFDEAEETLALLPASCQSDPSVLRAKGKILMMRSDVDGVDRRGDAMGYYEQYIQQQKDWLKAHMDEMSDAQREQYWLSFHDFLFDCYRLEDQAAEMLYDLALFSKGYLLEYQNKKAKSYTWKDIQKSLDAQSCAIEFVQYNGKDDHKQLAALVVTPHCAKPAFVHIADLEKLNKMRMMGGQELRVAVISLKPEEKNDLYNDTSLHTKIWTDDLLAATGGASKIYFAADGLLQQLAIEYMFPDPTRSCRRLTSTRMLTRAYKPVDTRKMLLFGGIDFGVKQEAPDQDNDELAYSFFQPYTKALVDLPGSQTEIDSVARLRRSDGDLEISRHDATDSAFRANAPNYPVILISTHGFFLGEVQDGVDMRMPMSDDAMSKSGLAFAGSRRTLTDTTFDATRPDGILSARELAQLDLDSVDLMVLSACQTGLGTITADGVYGVQRALKQAGVRTIIVSLWSVDDAATSILMRNFFRNLLAAGENPDVYEAFTLARLQLMTGEYNVFDAATLASMKKTVYAAPQYSNAFIMIDVQ